MKRILFATDFSDSCDNAFSYMKSMIEGKDIIVDIIHVYDIPVSSMSTLPYKAMQGMLTEKKNAAIRRMKDQMNDLSQQNKGKMYPVYGVYPSVYIGEVAEQLSSDLILMGLRGTYSMFEKIMGNTTAHTINQTHIPVLAVPPGANFRSIHNILFPTDIHEINAIHKGERDALVWLYNFWEVLKSPKIHLIHIEVDKSEAPKLLSQISFPARDFIVKTAPSVEEGIYSHLQETQADLLAFYKPQRKFWERLYHHSLTRSLLYDARIPLLVF